MEYFLLTLIEFFAWVLIHITSATQKLLKSDKGGVSLMPGIVLFPIIFTLFAGLINRLSYPYGFLFSGGIHIF